MLSKEDRDSILALARKYGARKVLLFGSSLAEGRDSHDIDLAVAGMPPSNFFKFYGELMLALSKPVDLVDLDCDSPFTRMVGHEGVAVYG